MNYASGKKVRDTKRIWVSKLALWVDHHPPSLSTLLPLPCASFLTHWPQISPFSTPMTQLMSGHRLSPSTTITINLSIVILSPYLGYIIWDHSPNTPLPTTSLFVILATLVLKLFHGRRLQRPSDINPTAQVSSKKKMMHIDEDRLVGRRMCTIQCTKFNWFCKKNPTSATTSEAPSYKINPFPKEQLCYT
jgi:hypothetical protein